MIYLNEQSENRQEFENLLQQAKDLTLSKVSSLKKPSILSGAEFELIVFNSALEASIGTPFENKLIHTTDREFPDIVAADFFGVEVKATKKDDWNSIGNSVLESSRVLRIQKIYMFFGKLGGQPEIKFRNYEECLKGIAVTHYPRYQIDMNLPQGQSIFDKMKIEYNDLRKQKNPVTPIRAYYHSILKEGQELWWINDNLDESTAPSPIIKSFSSLESSEKKIILATTMIFFPEVFSEEFKKYKRIAPYLAAKYGVVSSSLRDEFSAGGKAKVKYKDQEHVFPHVIGEMINSATLIKDTLNNQTLSELAIRWEKEINENLSPEEAWLKEVDGLAAHQNLSIKPSELYQAALIGSASVTFK